MTEKQSKSEPLPIVAVLLIWFGALGQGLAWVISQVYDIRDIPMHHTPLGKVLGLFVLCAAIAMTPLMVVYVARYFRQRKSQKPQERAGD